jgi:hypothetical protein
MPRSSIIRNDIRDTTNERFQLWLSDSLELYRLGDVRYGVALADILTSMTIGLCCVAGLCKLSKEEFLALMDHTYDHVQRKSEESL